MIGDRWGVSDDEVARRYPCDEVVQRPVLQAWRGVTVQATPDRIWPWITQLRFAPYSYDWIDNLGRPSPRQLLDVAPVAVGEHFTSTGGRRIGRVLSVSPPTQLTGRLSGVVMSYVLVPTGDHTRLLLKLVAARGRWTAPLLSVGDLVMARRQLLNFKRLAENDSGA